ncbi:MAG TPA: DUF3710 domain-containing protein [Streptosporangiaceae bacterium]|nr:DUF3710 domain-containing protein [Streptosporangiaceae bacterium]
MLRRRRREGEDSPRLDDQGGPDRADQEQAEDEQADQGVFGPWDIADNFPAADRIDCGSLLIPVREDFDVQLNVAEEQGAWVAIVHEESGMQLQAFAAPRSGGLWDEVRTEIATNIAESGGGCTEEYGPFGTELIAQVPIGAEDEPATVAMQPVRFLGFDGPRWFLRGVISGPAATDEELTVAFNALFGDVVVVRGDYPAPPREQLEIRLPEEARLALEEQLAAEGEERPDWYLEDPFTRGPEITETR